MSSTLTQHLSPNTRQTSASGDSNVGRILFFDILFIHLQDGIPPLNEKHHKILKSEFESH